jgi:inorganic pyrophosphatase
MSDDGSAPLLCRVEIPKGSRNRYKWDERLGGIKLDRFLFASVLFPADYGFVAETLAEDGDPLDAIVCVSEPTFPGIVIPVSVVALFRLVDEGVRDDKLLCVPCEDPGWNWIARLEDVPEQLRCEIAHFFSIYREPDGRAVEVEGWLPRDVALDVLHDSQRRFAGRRGSRACS